MMWPFTFTPMPATGLASMRSSRLVTSSTASNVVGYRILCFKRYRQPASATANATSVGTRSKRASAMRLGQRPLLLRSLGLDLAHAVGDLHERRRQGIAVVGALDRPMIGGVLARPAQRQQREVGDPVGDV